MQRRKIQMNEEITKARKQNMKIYSIYRAIGLDLIFYYAVEFLFLTQVKHISSADIVLGAGFYAVFMIIFQIPASIIVDRIGTRRCTILANIFNSIFVILIMCCKNLGMLIFAQFIDAICFSLKDISDTTLIRYSIPETKKKGEIYSKLEGKGRRNYFLLNACTSFCSGFLYVINPYIPMIISLCFTIVATIISFGFRDIEEEKSQQKETKEKPTIKNYMKDLMESIKFIVKSQRLRSLFLYSGITWGIFCLMGTYRNSLLVDIGTSEQIITMITAYVGIFSSRGAKWQVQFNNHFRNRSLSTILLMITFSILIIGITGAINISSEVTLLAVIICCPFLHISKGMSEVLTPRYLGNFAKEGILTQIYAVNAISRNVLRAIISFFGSYLLRITNTANSFIVIGILLLVTSIGLISYMKTRLGLKPEEYDENEIFKQEKLKNA